MQFKFLSPTLLLLICWGLLTCTSVQAATESFKLQRRLGPDGEWTTIANFTLKQLSPHSPVQLKYDSTRNRGITLSESQKLSLTSVSLVYYRALPERVQPVPGEEGFPVVTVSPCTIVRGFLAQDSSTVTLYERLSVVPGPNASLLGLQVSSETNLYHSKLVNGDECDLRVVQKLFPKVQMELVLGIAHPVRVQGKVRYEDIEELRNPPKNNKEKRKTEVKLVKNSDNEWEKQEVTVEEQSFLQKYWLYIAVFIVMTLLKNLNA